MSKSITLTSLTKGQARDAGGEGPRVITLLDELNKVQVDRDMIKLLGRLVEKTDAKDIDLLVLDRGRTQDLEGLRRYLRERTEASSDELADQLAPDVPIPSPQKVLGARREAELRLSMLQEFGAYSAEELGRLRSKAANRHALASRWRSKGKVFSVDYRGRQLFPGFQFDPSAAPLPAVADALAALPREEMSEWEVALWWVAANEWLGGERPVDLLGDDPAALPEAASHLAEPSAL